MAEELGERLRKGFPDFTRSEKAVASYMLANLRQLPFETAASIAQSVGVSQMTVGRFLRSLGYNGLGALKEELRGTAERAPLLISERVARLRRRGNGSRALGDNLELEARALIGVYELAETPAWRRIVRQIATADRVCVAGFQTVSGIAADFASRLEYARGAVRSLDFRNGTFAELFAEAPRSTCLVLFEMRRYTRLSHLLVKECLARRIPLVVICDTHCYWARDYTSNVLMVETGSTLFWDNQTAFVSVAALLLNDVIALLGDRVAERTRRLVELQSTFEAFQD